MPSGSLASQSSWQEPYARQPAEPQRRYTQRLPTVESVAGTDPPDIADLPAGVCTRTPDCKTESELVHISCALCSKVPGALPGLSVHGVKACSRAAGA